MSILQIMRNSNTRWNRSFLRCRYRCCVALAFVAISMASRNNHGFAANALSFQSMHQANFLSASSATFATGAVAKFGFVGTASNANNNDSAPYRMKRELHMNFDSNPRSRGFLVRRFTGDSTPYKFPVTPVRLVQDWPEEWPFQPQDFSRSDPSNDQGFYTIPKFVYHIDEPAVASLTQYYRKNIPPNSDILDICSSWVSHYPLEFTSTMNSIAATGMNSLELQFNDQLTNGYEARNLNETPNLDCYDDESFDVVTCVVSIDYLIEPVKVLKEVWRVLRPGGKMIVSQSNRCFPTKAIAMWLSMNDRQHLELINGYFQYAGGFEERNAYDITATLPDNSYRDPMFIVEAVKERTNSKKEE